MYIFNLIILHHFFLFLHRVCFYHTMEVMGKPFMVAALRFGTTDTGLAFSLGSHFETDELKIKLCYICDNVSHKTGSCLLLDKEKKYVAFGYDAAMQYAELVENEKQNDYYFFDRFTMSLHNNEVFHLK